MVSQINSDIEDSVFLRIAEELFKWDFKKKGRTHYISMIADFFFDAEQKKEFNNKMNDFEEDFQMPFEWYDYRFRSGNQKRLTFTKKSYHKGFYDRERIKIDDMEEVREEMRKIISWCRYQLKISFSQQHLDFANYTKEDLKYAIRVTKKR